MGQGEVEGQRLPRPRVGAVVDGAPGRGRGLLDGHDALPAQDQARPFHGPRAAVDGPLGRRLGPAGKGHVRYLTF